MRLASPVGRVPAYDLIETLDSDTNPSFSNRAEECKSVSFLREKEMTVVIFLRFCENDVVVKTPKSS